MTEPTVLRRRMVMLAPFGLVAVGGLGFATMLMRMKAGRFDPHDIGNPILGKPMPDFNLPDMPPGRGFSSADLRAAAKNGPVMLNFFASWCIPCAAEADVLAALSQQGLAIWGIAYKDKPEAAAAFLEKYGNPYARIAADAAGRTAIDFGLFGVPESYFVDAAGIVKWHLAGPLSDPAQVDDARAAHS